MKSYIITTGVLFALIAIAHVLRIVAEWPRFATDPFYLLLTIAAAMLSLWAWRILRVDARGRA
jgi:hypothetical protein